MFKSKKYLSFFKLFFLIDLVLFIFNNNVLYASPGIVLEQRIIQLQEEQINLLQQLNNTFNNLSLDSETRLSRMRNISEALNRVLNRINEMHQQLILRDQLQQQRINNASNHQNNNHRRY
ncbi:effector protein [Candidatus Phytoplasma ziziphi]|uniref:Effector protein n=1 Tax=Ziziphus jujuba witches'-broom phytoplasma TaxID=135727 RepID=A0A660HMB1_ZIZJU|nr:effector protein [Candidatus Phytoplasma ziziphi]AYJ01181.1 effector protein [Candidatus Phytoplasma ziziphi]